MLSICEATCCHFSLSDFLYVPPARVKHVYSYVSFSQLDQEWNNSLGENFLIFERFPVLRMVLSLYGCLGYSSDGIIKDLIANCG